VSDTDTWPILRRGTWLYDSSVPVEIRVLESAEFWGSGDYEDDEEIREDREELCYFLAYEMAGAPGVFCNLIPNLVTFDAAIPYAETKFPGIRWERTQ